MKKSSDTNSIKDHIKCPYCSKYHRSDAKFCSVTGKTLHAQINPPVISDKKADDKLDKMIRCPNCGKVYVKSHPKFCNKCGFKLIEDEKEKQEERAKYLKQRKKRKIKDKNCPYTGCDNEIPPFARYCTKCYQKVRYCKKCKSFSDAWADKCHKCSSEFAQVEPGDWLMFKGNPQRTGNSIDSINPELELKWMYPERRKAEPILTSPIIYRGMLYYGSCDKHIHAINQYNGDVVWKKPTNGHILSTPAIWNGLLFAASSDGRIYAQDARKGSPKWVYPTGSTFLISDISAPLLACEKGLIFASQNGEVHSINIETGKHNWRVVLKGDVPEEDGHPENKICAGPSYYKGKIFVATRWGRVYCLSADTGEQLWEFPKKRNSDSPFVSTPAMAAKRCFVPCRSGKFFALNEENGQDAWNSTVNIYGVVEGSPSIGFGKIMIGAQTQFLIALNLHTGGEDWRARNDKIRLIDSIFSTPLITMNELVFVGSNSGYVYGRHLENGEEFWKYKLDSPIRSAPAISDGFLYVTTTGGFLYAFKEKE